VSTILLTSFLVIAIERVPFRGGRLSIANLGKAVALILVLPTLFYVVFGVLLGVRLPGLDS
jgi:hypothetical protein